VRHELEHEVDDEDHVDRAAEQGDRRADPAIGKAVEL
jgi:hypothetical protein